MGYAARAEGCCWTHTHKRFNGGHLANQQPGPQVQKPKKKKKKKKKKKQEEEEEEEEEA